MTPDRNPATPDLMALFCLIGGAVREAGPRNLLMSLLMIGTYSPALGRALRMWMIVEGLYSTTEFEYDLYCAEDGEGGCDEIRRGRVNRLGPVWVWRHVDRFGRALLIPIQWGWMLPATPPLAPGRVSALAGLSLSLPQLKIFVDRTTATPIHAHFVTMP